MSIIDRIFPVICCCDFVHEPRGRGGSHEPPKNSTMPWQWYGMSGIIEDACCIKEQGNITKRVQRTSFFLFLCLVMDGLSKLCGFVGIERRFFSSCWSLFVLCCFECCTYTYRTSEPCAGSLLQIQPETAIRLVY